MEERIKARCKDFFERRHALEVEDSHRERKAQEIKRVRIEHDQELEQARRQYVVSRKKVVEDAKLEQRWLEAEKEWKQQNEHERRIFVRRKDEVSKREHGRGCLPENLEYDLEE